MVTQWIRSTEVVWEELDGQALLVHTATGARWMLNAAALALWKLCDGASALHELGEIGAFCRSLQEQGLVRPVQTNSTGPVQADGTMFLSCEIPVFRPLGLTSGPRRRPSPRGNSGPG